MASGLQVLIIPFFDKDKKNLGEEQSTFLKNNSIAGKHFK